ncbi:acyl-CoA dehydrogenase family protein [Cyclobacterium marinum]|uniref:acyl-CoA oxidase n=1 Tax=Cyclobacterium marinum (strain ATCC 25205 / DSM 745 / LMG 13164 / NCIMB 1802) TaxID=880070 RepID=G0J6F1_CYCMS|nr:acyl-CoA dehydrogenase [Cyclobacterium marinum]AEL27646.1 acyl-CoA oxidase domain-containing protein [Cyclobacterium marinum DSM 745]
MEKKLSQPTHGSLVLLPTLYKVWSDANITNNEHKAFQSFFNKVDWLSKEDREYLTNKLDPESPPSREELEMWWQTIKSAIAEEKSYPHLSSIGVDILKKNAPIFAETFPVEKAEIELGKLENQLGIIGKSAALTFKSIHSNISTSYETQTAFATEKLTYLLDGKRKPLIDEVKSFISKKEFDYVDPGNLREYREQVLLWCKMLADKGYGSIGFPKEYGGADDMEGYFTVMETLSYRDLSTVIKFGVQFGLWGMSVFSLGTKKHHEKYLKDIGSLQLPGCFAMTETNHGSNVRGIETTATYNHKEKTFTIHTPHINARKEYIGNAALHGKMATVFAKLIIDGKDYGVSTFIVPLRNEEGKTLPGISITDCGRKMGLNGVDNGLISFDSITIPKENMLDRFSSVDEKGNFQSPIASDNKRFFTMLGTLVGGRIGIPRSALAASKSGLTIAIRYADKRRQFGPDGTAEVPILNYRMHQRRMLPLLAKTYACHFAMEYVTDRFLNRKEEEMQEIEALAAGLKSYVTWHNTETLQECREACGGKGFLSENRIDALKNDSDVYTTFEGDNTVLLQLVAKSRLSAYKEQFENMNLFTIIDYVVAKAKTSLTEKNLIITRNKGEAHLLDSEFHMNAFYYRENSILNSAANRLKRLMSEGMDPFDAVNVAQHHLYTLSLAFIERVVLEKFIEKIEQTSDPELKQVLKQLCDLYALHQIEKHNGWYLEQGYMEGGKSKAIRKMVNQLCWDIRKDAVPLVNAFNIPDACLAAPIAI